MQNENKEVGLLALPTKLLLRKLDILLKLTDGILERRPRVVDLIDDENVLADQVGHLQRAEIQPLCAGDLGTGDFLGVAATEILVEGQADGLDGDVGITLALEERPARRVKSVQGPLLYSVVSLDVPEDASGDVATAADGDHKVRVEGIQDLIGRGLA